MEEVGKRGVDSEKEYGKVRERKEKFRRYKGKGMEREQKGGS